MKMKEARALIISELKQLKDNGSISAQQLQTNTQVALIQIYGIIKHLEELKAVSIEETDSGKFYKVIDDDRLNTAFGVDLLTPKKTESKSNANTNVSSIGRDTSKFIFEKIPYSKSKCVLMVVSNYVKKHNPSLTELKKTFPDSIVSSFGVIEILKTAKELSTDRPRYYLGEHHILTTSDNQKVVVCNQWTLARFIQFMEVAARLGYVIKPEK